MEVLDNQGGSGGGGGLLSGFVRMSPPGSSWRLPPDRRAYVFGFAASIRSSEQGGHRLGLDQFARLVEVVVDDGVRVDAKCVIGGRNELHRMHRVLCR